jgi:glycosyltransferase involved in cell wall biosynthesis
MDPTLGSKGRLLFGAIEGLFGKHLTDALICVSDDEYRHAAQDLKIPRNILHTVVNGCEPPPSGRRTEIRAQFHAADNDFIFGFVGRLSAQKAPERLIRAFASIAPALPQTRLAMIGFGEMQAQMEAEIDASGFADRIILTSAIAGPEAMQAFDCLVMPSRYEAMSYVMLEAAAAGLPLILTNVGGASTVLSDGENGYMVENSDDAMALSQAMTKVANPIIFRSLKERATARRDRYSLESMVAETERIYLQLSNSKSTQ